MSVTNAAAGERHVSIDAVRGFAVLGILLMNIVGMGLPSFSYIDPTYAGGSTGADLWTWAVNNVLTDGKMRALFTMLFGASAVLIAQRAEGGSPGPAQTHYRRMFWLFVFGTPLFVAGIAISIVGGMIWLAVIGSVGSRSSFPPSVVAPPSAVAPPSVSICWPSSTASAIREANKRTARSASSLPGIT